METFQPQQIACQYSACHGQEQILDLPFARARAAGGGDIRGVQLAGGRKHAVDVCENGTKPGERLMGQLEGQAEVISGVYMTYTFNSL